MSDKDKARAAREARAEVVRRRGRARGVDSLAEAAIRRYLAAEARREAEPADGDRSDDISNPEAEG